MALPRKEGVSKGRTQGCVAPRCAPVNHTLRLLLVELMAKCLQIARTRAGRVKYKQTGTQAKVQTLHSFAGLAFEAKLCAHDNVKRSLLLMFRGRTCSTKGVPSIVRGCRSWH